MARKSKDEATADQSEDGDFSGEIIKSLNKNGKVAYSYSDKEDPATVKYWISTGSTLLDYIISNRRNGGVPFGRITTISGVEGSGKSLIAATLCANVQKMGGIAVYFDTESSISKDFMMRLGVREKNLILGYPQTLEDCFQKIEDVVKHTKNVKSNKDVPVLIVLDSIAAPPSRVEIEGDYEPNSLMGVAAKTIAKGLRKITGVVGIEKVALVITNQLKYNMKMANQYDEKWIEPGGKSLPFHASVRVRLHTTPGASIKDDDKNVIGIVCSARTMKNRFCPPYRKAEFPIYFDRGIDDKQSWYDFLKDRDIIKKVAGYSKFSLDGKDISIPTDDWKKWLKEGENEKLILDIIEEKMVIKYDENKNLDEMITNIVEEKDITGEE